MCVRMPGQGPRSCAAAPAAVGKRVCRGRDSSLLRQNGGALPSLRRNVNGHHTGQSVSQPLYPLGWHRTVVGGHRFSRFPPPCARWQKRSRGITNQGGAKDRNAPQKPSDRINDSTDNKEKERVVSRL